MLNLLRYLTQLLIWMVIFVGLIVAGLRIGLANIDLIRTDIEEWVSYELSPGIRFSEIRSYWNKTNPVLELDNVSITLPDRSKSLAVDTISIELNLWDSLVLGTAVISEVTGIIDKITIRKDSEHRWWLNDINLVAAKSSAAASDIEDMLASIPHYLEIELRRLIVEDETTQQSYQIDNIFADIQHHDEATHLQLLADLPEIFGGSLKIKSILQQSRGIAYFQAEQLKLDPIAELFEVGIEDIRETEIAGEVWLRTRDHHVEGVDADISMVGAGYPHGSEDATVPFNLSLQFNADKQDKNWMVRSKAQDISVNEQALPDLVSQLRLVRDPVQDRFEGWLETIELGRFVDAGKDFLPKQLTSLVDQSKARVGFGDTWFSLPRGDFSGLEIMSRVIGLSNQPVGNFPGISGVDADIIYAGEQLKLSISEQQVSLDFTDQFIAPLEISKISLNAFVSFDSEAVTLSIPDITLANDDIKLAGRLWLETNQDAPPFFYLRANFDEGIGSQKSKYLPVKILPASARKWVDDGILAADISNGELLFHGRLGNIKKFEREMAGELMAGFDIDNADLTFAPNWSTVKQGKGHILFHNMGVDINLDSAHYAGIKNARGKISLSDFSNSVVLVDVNASAPTKIVLPVWLESPVGSDFRDIAKNLQDPGGRISANIKLSIPLADESLQEEVEVKLNLESAEINAPAWGIELSQINGELLITRDEISAKGVKAQFFKNSVVIDIDTDLDNQLTLIKANGMIETQQLLNLVPDSLTRDIEGKSDWTIDLAIANQPKSGSQPILTVDASSNLKGTAIHLPVPYNKNLIVKRPTTGRVVLQADNGINFEYGLGSNISGRGSLQKSEGDKHELVDLDLAFSNAFKAAESKGIRVYGTLPQLPVDEWITLYQFEAAQQAPDSRSLMPLLQTIDLDITTMELFGRQINNTEFFLLQSPSGFVGRIDSSVVKGKFDFPKIDSVDNPVAIDLEYARISASPSKNSGTGLVPNDLFNLRLRSKEFVYDNRPVTDLELDIGIVENQLLVDALSFQRDDIEFKFDGHWFYNPVSKEQNSHLNVSVKGKEFGQAMAKLGFGDTIHNGSIDFKGEIGWPDELMKPEWDLLQGKGKFKLEDGILKDVEPGSGRFVGLFSLNALPRRLALDFSDVLFEGMEFDEIKGDLVLDGQSLYTSNTRLDGPAAKVKVIGRTGLRDRNYDQKIYVVPKIRHALPVIGSILQGSGVGWGLLLLQNLFKSSIDDTIQIEYGLTGSWDEPVIGVVNKPEPIVEDKPKSNQNLEK